MHEDLENMCNFLSGEGDGLFTGLTIDIWYVGVSFKLNACVTSVFFPLTHKHTYVQHACDSMN